MHAQCEDHQVDGVAADAHQDEPNELQPVRPVPDAPSQSGCQSRTGCHPLRMHLSSMHGAPRWRHRGGSMTGTAAEVYRWVAGSMSERSVVAALEGVVH